MKRKILYGIGKAENNYCGHAPDYPGCIATGATIEETVFRLKRALKAHVQAMLDDGDELPDDDDFGGFIEIEVAEKSARPFAGQPRRNQNGRAKAAPRAVAAGVGV